MINAIKDFLIDDLPEFLLDIVDYIFSFVVGLFLKVFNYILTDIIPKFTGSETDIQNQFTSVSDLWATLPTGMIQLCTVLRFQECIAILTTALFMKAVLNRIPFIGRS